MVASFRRKRRSEELIASILSGVAKGENKTNIMYSACINFDLLNKYLTILQEADLVRFDGNSSYNVTKGGLEYLKHFQELKDMMKRMLEMEEKIAEKRKAMNSLLQITQLGS